MSTPCKKGQACSRFMVAWVHTTGQLQLMIINAALAFLRNRIGLEPREVQQAHFFFFFSGDLQYLLTQSTCMTVRIYDTTHICLKNLSITQTVHDIILQKTKSLRVHF